MNTKQAILVVDDDTNSNKLLVAHLEPCGYKVISAFNGEEALKIISNSEVDLVLLDIMMPGIDGLEVCRVIKNNEKTKFLPVVMVTSLQEREEKILSVESGADDFLTKPVNKAELMARVKSLLRIKLLHDELEKSYIQLKELQKLKDDLSAMITHDINNYLAGVKGNLDLMYFENDTFSDDVKRYLQVARECSDDMVTLVSDFMDISKMEENKLEPRLEDTDINVLVYHAIENTTAMAKNADIKLMSFKDSQSFYFKVDKSLISRVIVNLIINSIKFTPKGGIIEIKAEISGSDLRVSVKDSGSGILPEFSEKIFEKFSQIQTKQANLKRGRGLGLTFCKLAVEAHGGRIWVESEGKDKGSTFIFTIPKR